MPTILVVDDEKDAIEMMRAWLSRKNYTVLTATRGEEAIRLAEAHGPDLILLDVMMPGMNGIETCKLLRSGERTGHIPVILITAYDPAVGRVEALMAGASDYVTKPILFNDLAERMQALLAQGEEFIDQSQRLLQETVHAALVIVPCNLAWLLTTDTRRRVLVGQAAATTQGEQAARQFSRHIAGDSDELLIPLRPDGRALTQAALTNVAVFNMPLSALRDSGERAVYEACSNLNLYFVSILPLQISGTPVGLLVLGLLEPQDVETTHGRQLLASVASQAATVVNNARLMHSLATREAESRRERLFRQAVLDTMSDGLVVYDTQGQITFFNRRLTTLTGCTQETLQGANIEDLFVPVDRKLVRRMLRATRSAQTSSLETRLLCADGTSLPVLAVQGKQLISRGAEGGEERVMVLTDLSDLKAREKALTRQTQRLSALNRATQAIASSLALDEIIDTILNEATGALDATAASVLLRAPDSDEMVFQAAVGPNAEKVCGLRVPLSQGIAGVIAREGQPVLIESTGGDEQLYADVNMLTGMATTSVAAAPLIVDGQVIGAIEVANRISGVFDQADLDILESLAHSAAIAIRNARLYDEAQRRVRELTLLFETGEAASSTLAIEKVLGTVAQKLSEALAAGWCIISSWERPDDTLMHLAEVIDIVWPEGQRRKIDPGDYPRVGDVIRGVEALIVAPDEVECLDTPPAHFTSGLLLPIALEGGVSGLAILHHISSQQGFSQEDIERCQNALVVWRTTFLQMDRWSEPANLRQLSARLLRVTGASRCAIFTYQPEDNTLSPVHQASRVIWPPGQGWVSALDRASLRRVALIERTPVVVRMDGARLSPADQAAFPQTAGVLLITPLMSHGEAIGLLELIDINPEREFSDEDLSLAQAVGDVVGNALENARLYAALLRRAAQLEAAYNDLQEADRLKDEWIQNVSHELRTPLASIIGFIDLLLQGDLGPLSQEQINSLTLVSAKSRQLARQVGDILTIQKMEREPLERSMVSICDLARSAIEAVQPAAGRAGIEIQADFPADLPDLYVDATLIREVFVNLLGNAIKFSPQGGRITVSIQDVGPAVRVAITDQGIGIPPEEHDRIWRRFYQIDGSMTRQYGGTGLGLAIVKQVVEKHEGHVWVESEPGKGSTFSFVLPRVAAPAAEEEAPDELR